jgi:hypothetical protein
MVQCYEPGRVHAMPRAPPLQCNKLMDSFSSQLCILRTLLHVAAWQPRGRGKGERKKS